MSTKQKPTGESKQTKHMKELDDLFPSTETNKKQHTLTNEEEQLLDKMLTKKMDDLKNWRDPATIYKTVKVEEPTEESEETERKKERSDLFRKIKKDLKTHFTTLKSWGILPTPNTAIKVEQTKRIKRYLESLPVEEKDILSRYLKERQALVKKNASPSGEWYLFTLLEGFALLARLESEPASKEMIETEVRFFAEKFFSVWFEDGQRVFRPDEVVEIYDRIDTVEQELDLPHEKGVRKEQELRYYVKLAAMNESGSIKVIGKKPLYVNLSDTVRPIFHDLDEQPQESMIVRFHQLRGFLKPYLQPDTDEEKQATAKKKLHWKGRQKDLVYIMDTLKKAGYLEATDNEIVAHFEYGSQSNNRLKTYRDIRRNIKDGTNVPDPTKLKDLFEKLRSELRIK